MCFTKFKLYAPLLFRSIGNLGEAFDSNVFNNNNTVDVNDVMRDANDNVTNVKGSSDNAIHNIMKAKMKLAQQQVILLFIFFLGGGREIISIIKLIQFSIE